MRLDRRQLVAGALGASTLVLGWPRGAAARAPSMAPGTLGLTVGFDALRWQDPATLAREFQDYAHLGVSWLRTDLNWREVQKAGPDSYDWSGFDTILALAERHGIGVAPVAGFAPDWIEDRRGPVTQDERAAYARFVARAVERYRPRGLTVWEIWNEPNMSGFWRPKPDPVAYARLLEAARAAIQAVDPSATVILGGLAAAASTGKTRTFFHHSAFEFLQTVYAEVGRGAFDAVGFHPYTFPRLPSESGGRGWGMMTGPIRRLMEAQGDASKPVWINEYGAPTNLEGGISEARQAEMLREAHALAAGYPWAGPLLWYSYRDLGDDPANREDWFGLVRATLAPKPAYQVFRELAVPA